VRIAPGGTVNVQEPQQGPDIKGDKGARGNKAAPQDDRKS